MVQIWGPTDTVRVVRQIVRLTTVRSNRRNRANANVFETPNVVKSESKLVKRWTKQI